MDHERDDDEVQWRMRTMRHMDGLPIEAVELWQALNAAISDAHHRGVSPKVISDTAELVFRNAHAEAFMTLPTINRP